MTTDEGPKKPKKKLRDLLPGGGPDPDVSEETSPSETEREWQAEWLPKGGQLVVGAHNIEFSDSSDSRRHVIPDRPAYLDLLDHVAVTSIDELVEQLGRDGAVPNLAAAVVADRAEHSAEQDADVDALLEDDESASDEVLEEE